MARKPKRDLTVEEQLARGPLDLPFLMLTMLLLGVGLIMMFSASFATAYYNDGDPLVYIKNQAVYAAAGVVVMFLVSKINYQTFRLLSVPGIVAAILLLVLALSPLGVELNEVKRWVRIGPIQFQPSEVLKLAFILTFSLHLAKDESNMNKPLHMLLLCVHGAIPTGLIALQGDYGTAIVFAVVFLGMLFAAKISWKYVLAFLIATPLALVAAWNFILGDTHKKRILVLLHPGTDPENIEYQQDRGLEALSNGKIFGVGLHAGKENYVSVPEIHNDFMFAQVGQALGFVGAVAVVLVLIFLCLKVLYDGFNTKDKMGMFLCTGVFCMLFIHCVMNIGMVLKVAPVIGVPLPFISAGGTATVSMYVALGLVVSAYGHNEKKYRVFE